VLANEAKSLGGIEPLYCSDHSIVPIVRNKKYRGRTMRPRVQFAISGEVFSRLGRRDEANTPGFED
ncbi:MAG TPA: hypothetical protein QF665_00615, partial [Alphaproteobacteria bacterium]|nr:hypothetical protein [Alphaproteobacteria bacterium]